MSRLLVGLLLGAGLALAGGCGDDGPAADAASSAAETAQEAGHGGTAAVKDLGAGLKPQRGPVQVLPPGSVPVEFEPAQMDFGVLSPGDAARGTSRIWNTGTRPLTIVKSITSCGCTAAEDLAGRVIEPGGYTEFSTTMNMKSGLGEKKEKITVYFGPDGKRVAIQYYTAEVSLPVKLTPPHIPASTRDETTGRWVHTMTGEITVESLDGRPFSVIRTHDAPPEFVGFDPAVDEPRREYVLRWDLNRFGQAIPWFWVVETDHPGAPLVDARVQHAATLPPKPPGRMWVPKDQRVLVGLVRRGEPFEITTRIEYGGNYVPDPSTAGVASLSPSLAVALVEAQADDAFLQYRIEVTVTGGEPGLLYEPIQIQSAGFPAPLYVIGRLVE